MRIDAPWTPEQVKLLNEYQKCGLVHPFTCGNEDCRADLVATKDGWICPNCDYTQDWAHEVMVSQRFHDGLNLMNIMEPMMEKFLSIKIPQECVPALKKMIIKKANDERRAFGAAAGPMDEVFNFSDEIKKLLDVFGITQEELDAG